MMDKNAMLRAQVNARQSDLARTPGLAAGALGLYRPEAHVSINWMDGRIQHQVNLRMPNELVGHILVRINELLEEHDAEAKAAQQAFMDEFSVSGCASQ